MLFPMTHFYKSTGWLLSTLFLIISCNENSSDSLLPSAQPTPKDAFTVQTSITPSSNTQFILLTNQHGEVLYESNSLSQQQDITIEKEVNDQVDLTYGVESPVNFDIRTYRNIPTGFLLTDRPASCEESFGSNNLVDLSQGQIDIEGVTTFEHLYNPLHYKESTSFDPNNQKVTIRGSIPLSQDLILTLFLGQQEGYKSVRLANDKWEQDHEGKVKRSISIQEFFEPIVHTIQLEKSGQWLVNAELLDQYGNVTILAKGSHFEDYQQGDQINLFIPRDFTYQKVRLSINNGPRNAGFSFHKTLSNIPDEIKFNDPNIEFVDINPDGYNLSVDQTYDLAEVEFEYIANNWISHWTIYQQPDQPLLYQLPHPNEFLPNSTFLKEQISQPNSMMVRLYHTENTNIIKQKFEQSNIEKHLDCLSFTNKIKFQVF